MDDKTFSLLARELNFPSCSRENPPSETVRASSFSGHAMSCSHTRTTSISALTVIAVIWEGPARRYALLIVCALLFACSRRSPEPIRIVDLLEQNVLPGRVVVDVVERIEPVESPGQPSILVVYLPEETIHGRTLAIHPGSFPRSVLDTPTRIHGSLVPASPLEVFGPIAERLILRVEAIEPLEESLPTTAPSAEAMSRNRSAWDRRRVIYEGTWTDCFENSSLDATIWLTLQRSAIGNLHTRSRKVAGECTDADRHRVRVTGRLYAHASARYGHLGAYPMALDATQVDLLSR